MKAMVLAAGLGTRLRPLTNDRPKALVEVGGRTLLEITLARLREFGIREVIVNVHHFADQVIDFLQAHRNFGMRVEISGEDELLDTGGGLKKAGWFFLEDGRSDEPFILHNVDVISTLDLAGMLEFHKQRKALATLATLKRETSRYLLFDKNGRLCGRRSGRDGVPEFVGPSRGASEISALAFSGIHVISPRIFSLLTENGAFSIITSYLRLAGQGESVLSYQPSDYYWRDLGRPGNIGQVEEELKSSR
jgi:NDP-sugar pyrophosphorylase family protein